jgi:hypothetical protein
MPIAEEIGYWSTSGIKTGKGMHDYTFDNKKSRVLSKKTD